MAARLTGAVVEALPAVSAFAGKIAAVLYWMIRIKIWLDQHT